MSEEPETLLPFRHRVLFSLACIWIAVRLFWPSILPSGIEGELANAGWKDRLDIKVLIIALAVYPWLIGSRRTALAARFIGVAAILGLLMAFAATIIGMLKE